MSEKKYHKYVFDIKNRKFVGSFEEMYQNESKEHFDSWHQEDSRQLQRHILFEILNSYNFSLIFDLGCGKGAFTHLLKKFNNKVIGLDIAPTALTVAKERYPDIEFLKFDFQQITELCDFFQSQIKHQKEKKGGGIH